jgi:glycosyltransferase involved in cell wall biosynthesis
VVLLDAECPGDGWLERLDAAAGDDPRTATAALGAENGDCVLVRRAAYELAGPFDESLAPADALATFRAACLGRGLRHADAGSGADPALRRSPSVTIDGRCLDGTLTGTGTATLELVASLCAHTDVDVRVLASDDLSAGRRAQIVRFGARCVTDRDARQEGPTDLAHRPYQAGAAEDVLLLRDLGRRVVITQLDCIAYRTAAYFDTTAEWKRYRELTEASLAAADEVVFISADALDDARALGLLAPGRGTVISLAADAPFAPAAEGGLRPIAEAPSPRRPYLLCLGTDFGHKNRPFAIRLLAALVEREQFDGELVFAGPHVAHGSSAPLEDAELLAHPTLVGRVSDRGPVDEIEKRSLLAHAAAVVYPTTFEGFGLIPFEAALADVPALFAWTSALREHMAPDLALLTAWDPLQSARDVRPVLEPGSARDRLVHGIREAGAPLSAAYTARCHAQLYARVRSAPRAGAVRVALRSLEQDAELRRLQGTLGELHTELDVIYEDPIARGLAGRQAIVPEELGRIVLAFASRPALRKASVKLYRAVAALRGRG